MKVRFNMMDIMNQIGQLFIIGFKGETLPKTVSQFLTEEQIGGVILFRDNCTTHLKTKSLIDSIKKCYSAGLPFISVDQEGGRVSRITGAPAEIASAGEYGTERGIDRFNEDYRRSMMFIESLGFNINFAPVCDLYVNNKNRCLMGRCFGKTAEKVIPFVESAVEIAYKSGILSCLKHFPGLGAATIDPHEQTAIAYYDQQDWQHREGLVFTAGISKGADMIMTTHLKLPKFDNTIVTGSEYFIDQVLRENLSFHGTVITDDLTMKGADELGDIGERTIKAFNAGHDLLLFGQDFDLAIEAYERFRQAYEHGDIDPERLHTALDRIRGLKFKLTKSVLL